MLGGGLESSAITRLLPLWRGHTKSSVVFAFHNVWYLGFVIGTQVTATSGKIYTVVKEIGRGGFGNVYLVQDEAGAQHALKILSPAREALHRLLRRGD
jgi:serine/threonine protein kinase